MRNPKSIFIKACKIVAAEGLFVFFRKAIRRLFWTVGSSFSSASGKDRPAYRKSPNAGVKLFLVQQVENEIRLHDAELIKLIKHFKKELIEIAQKEKF